LSGEISLEIMNNLSCSSGLLGTFLHDAVKYSNLIYWAPSFSVDSAKRVVEFPVSAAGGAFFENLNIPAAGLFYPV
jgi:hypothetical protein